MAVYKNERYLSSQNNLIHSQAKVDDYVTMGSYNVIEKNCSIGYKVEIENHCALKERTIVGHLTRLENGTRTSGFCTIGSHCVVKQNCVIARQVTIGEGVFISPNVVFLYTDHKGLWGGRGTVVEDNVFIGASTTILSGVTIAKNIVIGAGSLVTKDLTEPGGVYIGSPAVLYKKTAPSPEQGIPDPGSIKVDKDV